MSAHGLHPLDPEPPSVSCRLRPRLPGPICVFITFRCLFPIRGGRGGIFRGKILINPEQSFLALLTVVEELFEEEQLRRLQASWRRAQGPARQLWHDAKEFGEGQFEGNGANSEHSVAGCCCLVRCSARCLHCFSYICLAHFLLRLVLQEFAAGARRRAIQEVGPRSTLL